MWPAFWTMGTLDALDAHWAHLWQVPWTQQRIKMMQVGFAETFAAKTDGRIVRSQYLFSLNWLNDVKTITNTLSYCYPEWSVESRFMISNRSSWTWTVIIGPQLNHYHPTTLRHPKSLRNTSDSCCLQASLCHPWSWRTPQRNHILRWWWSSSRSTSNCWMDFHFCLVCLIGATIWARMIPIFWVLPRHCNSEVWVPFVKMKGRIWWNLPAANQGLGMPQPLSLSLYIIYG